MSLALEGANLELALVEGWPALEIPRGLLRLEGRAVEFTVPEASMAATDGRKLSLKGTFAVDLDEPLPRTGHLALKAQGPLAVALEMLDQSTRSLCRARDHVGGHRRQDRRECECQDATDAADATP